MLKCASCVFRSLIKMKSILNHNNNKMTQKWKISMIEWDWMNEQRLFRSDPCRLLSINALNKTALIVMDKLIFWVNHEDCVSVEESDLHSLRYERTGTSLFHVVIYSLWLIHGWREYSGSAAPRWAEPSSPLRPWRHMTTAACGVHAQIWAQSQEVCRSQADQNTERPEPVMLHD